ncbi:Hsp70 family protein [Corynebacterium aquatimens]|uniref:Molecular chaperone DnaK (HSP70) n=1 Tax=Corynebacterium aquatimens TaxID=1190508 RepID=A0A931E2K9_9CORY|nr:Hsp70 family protein [Corynebacterium aquatimens]MBG6122631.1 molecular chaperone DnaK (HSP70) [Corynebacterium aquatimens]WJY64829.1 Chaperone protein DnaK [Corynebacterium aquatimens]
MSSHWALSIDFGTSNTSAAHTNPFKGTVEPATLSDDHHSMASSVLVSNTGAISAGPVALANAEGFPEGFIRSPKRLIGQDTAWLGGGQVAVQSMVSEVFRETIRRASRAHNNLPPRYLVVTHPEVWSPDEIAVLKKAAADAGMPPNAVATLSEPKAAIAHYTQDRALVPGQKIAVFDIGGGTLDIAVLNCRAPGAYDVLAAEGDGSIGGRSFDQLLRRWLERHLDEDEPDVLDALRRHATFDEQRKLEQRITDAKELLSDTDRAVIPVDVDGKSHRVQITRGEFEDLISPSVDRAVGLARAALAQAGLTPHDLHALYLTGGTSRVPLLQEKLKDIGPVAQLDNPKTVVCQGALVSLIAAVEARRAHEPVKTSGPRRAAHPQPQRVVSPRRRRT